MNFCLPVLGAASCTAVGVYSKTRQHKKVKILSACADCVSEIIFLLQSECYSTAEILNICAGLPVGEVLECLGTSVEAVDNGEDLYTAWDREADLFCKKNGIDPEDVPVIKQTVKLLGSMDYAKQCAAYQALSVKICTQRDKAMQQYRVNGTAAVKIGLLSGIGIGLLLWRP